MRENSLVPFVSVPDLLKASLAFWSAICLAVCISLLVLWRLWLRGDLVVSSLDADRLRGTDDGCDSDDGSVSDTKKSVLLVHASSLVFIYNYRHTVSFL
jgi:hypothetical protein